MLVLVAILVRVVVAVLVALMEEEQKQGRQDSRCWWIKAGVLEQRALDRYYR